MPIEDWSDSIMIAQLNDEPALSEDMENLSRRLDERGEELPHVIVNLKAVSYLNSSNIAQLLKVRKTVLGGGRGLRICSISDQVWSVLLATGLDNLFDFTEDISTSLASLQIDVTGDGS